MKSSAGGDLPLLVAVQAAMPRMLAVSAHQLRRCAAFVVSGALASTVLAALDLALREPSKLDWHLAAHVALFLVVGVAAALGVWMAYVPIAIGRALLGKRLPRTRRRLGALYLAVLAFVVLRAAAVAPLHERTPSLGRTLLVSVLSVGSVLLGCLGVGVVAAAFRRAARGVTWSTALAVSALVLAGAALIAIDQTVLVSLYERAHGVLEGIALTLWALAGVLTCTFAGRRTKRLRHIAYACAVVFVVWVVVFCSWTRGRRLIEASLPDLSQQPLYAARMVRRVHQAEVLWRHGPRSNVPPGLQRLVERYELHDTVIDDAWTSRAEDVRAVDDPLVVDRDWNVIVFFVDTLRNDVASDPEVMPSFNEWEKQATSFKRAYSSGSSTLLGLPPMLGCRYDATPQTSPKLLEAARMRGMRTALFIPTAASDYHRSYYPNFSFDHHDVVPDDKERTSTANDLVDRAMTWLRAENPERFFLWLYHFDVHNWSGLDPAYLDRIATRAGYSRTDGLPWKYRAAARGVDDSFTRLRAGLDQLGLTSRTVILFVADHGEGLGQQGFWIHTTHLWESLVQVPLAVSVPGVRGARVDSPVSLVDVAPTLARFIAPLPGIESCHGQDLLARQPQGPRRLPILFSAWADGEIVRVGQLGDGDRKLIVDLTNGQAQLFHVNTLPPEDHDISQSESATLTPLLSALVRSPIFPRP